MAKVLLLRYTRRNKCCANEEAEGSGVSGEIPSGRSEYRGFLKEVSFVLNFKGWAEKWRLDRRRGGEKDGMT